MKNKKDCQLGSCETCLTYVCGEVLKRTGFRHAVSKKTCNNCSEELIKCISRNVVEIHKRLDKEKSKSAPYKELSIVEMGKNFTSAIKRVVKMGFKTVSKEEYIERLMCCTTCSREVNRCPYCGCKLSWKDRLASEKGCPNKETYPNLSVYPPRNYWLVVGELTSVIILARNEELVNKTIESLFKNATGEIEIIVVLDGYEYDVLEDSRITVIRNKEPLGRRVSFNNAAVIAEGKYLLHTDAHCSFPKGWDTKLKCACNERTLVTAVLRELDGETWEFVNNKRIAFSYLDKKLKDNIWSTFVSVNKDKVIEEVMAFSGAVWMIQKEYFGQLGGFDEKLAGYGHTGSEWSLKVWCNEKYPGRVLVRKDVECGHVFATNKDHILYVEEELVQEAFCRIMKATYSPERINKMLSRFHNVPGWDEDDKEMVSIIIPSRNEPFLNKTIENLLVVTRGRFEIVVVLDGYDCQLPQDDRIKVIRNKESLGRRVSINKAALEAKGKYLFILDAHCTMSKGWDTKLKQACDANSLVVSTIKVLDEKTFEIDEKKGIYSFAYLNLELNEKWWGSYKKLEDCASVEEMMCFTGCAWMIQKEYYWKLNGYDDLSLGKYGYDGPEWSLKVWCNEKYPGRVLLHTDVVCGHIFGTNLNNAFYKVDMALQSHYHSQMKKRWGDRIHLLIDKFPTAPGWRDLNTLKDVDAEDEKKEVKEEKAYINKKDEIVTRDVGGKVTKRVTKIYKPIEVSEEVDITDEQSRLEVAKDVAVEKIVISELVGTNWNVCVLVKPEEIEHHLLCEV